MKPLLILFNVHEISPLVYRMPQFGAGWMGALLFRLLGLRTLVNLRGTNLQTRWYRRESALCAAQGCALIDIPLSSKRLPSRGILLKAMAAMEGAEKPLAIKCAGGADRSGLIAMLWLLKQSAPIEVAQKQIVFWPLLHALRKEQRWIGAFCAFYQQTRGDFDFQGWLEQRYDAQAFAAFLVARGQGDFWRAS